MQFAYAWVLFLLISVPFSGALWYGFIWRKRRRLERHFDPELGRRFIALLSHGRLGSQLGLLLSGLILALIGLARPCWIAAPRVVLEPQHDLVVALDVSRSMLARDVTPDRLERAKAMVYDLIMADAGRRIALVAFRYGAQRVCPLTRDTDFLLQSLDGMHVDSAPPGPTDLAAAIRVSMAAFDPDRSGSRTVLLVSDGEHLVGELDVALKEARHSGIRFVALGIGTTTGASIPDERSPTGRQKHDGARVVTRLVHETLEQIAVETGGQYIPAGDAMVDLNAMLRQFPPPVTPDPRAEVWAEHPVELSSWFLSAAFIMFLSAAMLSRGRPSMGRHVAVAILVLWFSGANHGYGRNLRATLSYSSRPARQAIEHYRNGEYKAAAERFEAAAARDLDSSLSRALRYNAGCARYRAGDYESAIQHFRHIFDQYPDPPAYLRHDLSLAELAAARAVLPTLQNMQEISAVRKRIQSAAAQLEQSLRERPRKKEWHTTALHLDRKLARAKNIENMFRLSAEYADWTAAEIVDDLLQRQRAIQRDLTIAHRLSLPYRLMQQPELAAQQRAVAGRTSILSKIVGRDTVDESGLQKAIETTRAAIEWIADADDRALATVHEAVMSLEAIRQDLPVSDEKPAPEHPETVPDRNNDLPDAAIPSDPEPEITNHIDDPHDLPDYRRAASLSVETWEQDRVEGLLDKIRWRERHYLEERRRRAIQPIPEDRDW